MSSDPWKRSDRPPLSDPMARAFPARPLRLRAPIPIWRAWLVGALGFLLFAGGGTIFALELAPGLASDHAIRASAVSLPKTRVESGRCQVRLFLLHDCTIRLAIPQDRGPPLRRELRYAFIEPGRSDRQAMAMGDPARPELISTDLGLDRFVNRAATFGGLALAMVGLCLAALTVPLRAGRERRAAAALSGHVLNPIPARLELVQQAWKVTPLEGGQAASWNLGAKGAPFVMDPQAGIVLAVTASAGGPAFPLDEKLSWLDLTEEERAAIWAARAEIQRAGR